MKGWLVGIKQEMTKIRANAAFVPVTLIKVAHQEVVRYKTQENDGYAAWVVGVEKKELKKDRGQKIAYAYQCEFEIDDEFMQAHGAGTQLQGSVLDGVENVRVVGISKGKGFQGVMKRHNFAGGPETHGSKFHRVGGSTGNRKPRRTHKGHPMAGRMGNDRITLKSVPVVAQRLDGQDHIVALKWSVPGAYNSFVQLRIA